MIMPSNVPIRWRTVWLVEVVAERTLRQRRKRRYGGSQEEGSVMTRNPVEMWLPVGGAGDTESAPGHSYRV